MLCKTKENMFAILREMDIDKKKDLPLAKSEPEKIPDLVVEDKKE